MTTTHAPDTASFPMEDVSPDAAWDAFGKLDELIAASDKNQRAALARAYADLNQASAAGDSSARRSANTAVGRAELRLAGNRILRAMAALALAAARWEACRRAEPDEDTRELYDAYQEFCGRVSGGNTKEDGGQ